MASNWKGWRLIIIGEQRFRWGVDFHDPSEAFSLAYSKGGESWSPDQLFVRPEETPGSLLTINWPACRGPTVTPQIVRDCIEAAFQEAWLAGQSTVVLDGTDFIAVKEDGCD